MSVIYKPAGRAQEYSELALNLYDSCGHRCLYCFAPLALHQKSETWGLDPKPRPDIIQRLRKDAPKAAADGVTGNVLLCFTCDPYQAIDEIHQLTRQAINILHDNGFNVTILTKGGKRAERDFDLSIQGDQFATTLTFLDEKQSLEWEPKAATPAERIKTIIYAHAMNIETWVSLEPVIETRETLAIIEATHTFVDLFKVGTLNYTGKLPEPFRSQVKDIDWPKFAKDVIATLEQYRCQFYLKNDLRRYL